MRRTRLQDPSPHDDRAILSPLHPYPAIVSDSLRNSRNPVRFGAFPDFDRIFCISESALYLWPPDSPSDYRVIHDSLSIRFAGMVAADSSVFVRSVVRAIVVYVTDEAVSIVAVGHDWGVFDERLTRVLGFTPTAMGMAGDGVVMVGSSHGVIHGIWVVVDGGSPVIEVRPLTSLGFVSQWVPFGLAVTAIVGDDSTGNVAAVFGRSELRFFDFSEASLREVSRFEGRDESIVGIEAIPRSDSSRARFIVFTEKGGRVVFGRNSSEHPMERIARLDPPFPGMLLTGTYSLNWSVFVYEQGMIVLHPIWDPGVALMDPPEVYQRFESRSPIIGYAHWGHKFRESPSSWVHSYQWQHVLDRPVGYVFCRAGVRELGFDRRVDTLARLIAERGAAFDEWLRSFLASEHGFAEAAATALLLASISEENEHVALSVLARIAEMAPRPLQTRLSVTMSAFILRIARILSVMQGVRLLRRKRSGAWTVSPYFKTLGPLKSSLSNLVSLGDKCFAMRSFQLNSMDMGCLKEFVNSVIEFLNMREIILQQKSDFSQGLDTLMQEHKHRLTTEFLDFSDLASFVAFKRSLELAVGAMPGKRMAHAAPPRITDPYRAIQDTLEERAHLPHRPLSTPQDIFDECCHRGFWDLVLVVISIGTFTGGTRFDLIQHVWGCFMREQLSLQPLSAARRMIVSTVARIPRGSDVLAGLIVVPLLEELRIRNDGHVLWAVETMLECGMDPTDLLDAYLEGLAQEDLRQDYRCDFVYAIALLIENGADVGLKPIRRHAAWFRDYGTHCPYYRTVIRILSRF
jgi:hypothetical protein